MFVGKARIQPYRSGAPEMFFTQEDAYLTRKQQTRLESIGRGKYSSLLQTFVNYGHKRFTTLGPGKMTLKLRLGGFCLFGIRQIVTLTQKRGATFAVAASFML